MDLAAVVRVTEVLLGLGLTIHSGPIRGGYMCRITGGKTPAVGVGATFYEAFARASWRWTQS